MVKVMHVDTVFEVFIFKFFFLVTFFIHEGVPIWWWLIFSKPSNPRFRGKVVQKCPIWGHHTQIHDFTALNAGIRRERKIYFWHHLYHRDHGGRLIPASYVVPKINQYLILRKIYFFTPKSLLMCIPNVHYIFIYVMSLHMTCVRALVLYMYVPSSLCPRVQYLLPGYPLTFKMWVAIYFFLDHF